MSTGEAAHLAVTSMGTWCKLGKQLNAQLSAVVCLAISYDDIYVFSEPQYQRLSRISIIFGQIHCEMVK